jgi:uncharacterized protein YceH (UPF0502 family)
MERLTAVQRRVLGTLIEKAFTTPAGCPLTLNALHTGCNQLTCREPVSQYSEAEISKAVQDLKRLHLAKEGDYEKGSRVDRFQHDVAALWDERSRAILAELFLRGPQTAGELKTNASRMTPIPDLAEVSAVLGAFVAAGLARELPRQPGKSSVRYDHLLYAEEVAAAPAPTSSSLEERVAKLEAEVEALKRAFKPGGVSTA